jgi:stage II sporulation protein P
VYGVIATKRIWAAKQFLAAYVVAIGFTIGLLVNRTPGGGPAVTALAGGDGHSTAAMEETQPREDPLWLQIFRPSQATARLLLRYALPMLSTADPAAQPNKSLVVYWSGRGSDKPQTLFQTMLPFLHGDQGPTVADSKPAPPPPSALPGGANPPGQAPGASSAAESNPPEQPAQTAVVNGGLPLIGIYHTHDWESYISEFPTLAVTSQQDLNTIRSFDHKKRTVVDLGRTLALRLKSLGVISVHADGTHQSLGYDYAYDASRVTAKRILSEHPTVKVLIDIHRDGTYGQNTTAIVNGQKVAKIGCIIGDVSEPHWEQNKAFCEKIRDRLEKNSPGITVATRVQHDQYNQDLITGAVLFEMGGPMNQYAEAERSINYLAQALAQIAREGAFPH